MVKLLFRAELSKCLAAERTRFCKRGRILLLLQKKLLDLPAVTRSPQAVKTLLMLANSEKVAPRHRDRMCSLLCTGRGGQIAPAVEVERCCCCCASTCVSRHPGFRQSCFRRFHCAASLAPLTPSSSHLLSSSHMAATTSLTIPTSILTFHEHFRRSKKPGKVTAETSRRLNF